MTVTFTPPGTPARDLGPSLSQLVDDAFVGLAGSSAHPCLGARAVVHRGAYDLHVYERLASAASATALCADLTSFSERIAPSELSSFVAVFEAPRALTEARFDALLWRQLQRVHDVDRSRFDWDGRVSNDPESPRFSFSVAGHAFFVIGLHPGSSRWGRRFAWPALVFNPHEQFTALRESGKYDRLRSTIRVRDRQLQGDVNPMLSDHGTGSEARQYSGRVLDDDWRCPLRVRPPH